MATNGEEGDHNAEDKLAEKLQTALVRIFTKVSEVSVKAVTGSVSSRKEKCSQDSVKGITGNEGFEENSGGVGHGNETVMEEIEEDIVHDNVEGNVELVDNGIGLSDSSGEEFNAYFGDIRERSSGEEEDEDYVAENSCLDTEESMEDEFVEMAACEENDFDDSEEDMDFSEFDVPSENRGGPD